MRANTTSEVTVGIDNGGTSIEAAQLLWRLLQPSGRLFIYNDPVGSDAPTFHPKIYWFEKPGVAKAIVGSSNLTRGGLFTNHEASLIATLDLGDPVDVELGHEILAALVTWASPAASCRILDPAGLQELHDSGDLPSE